MKRHISYILLLALAAASCAKDEPAAEPAAVEDFLPATLSASFVDGDGADGGTKVHILSNNTMVWNARDEISVFGNPDNVKYVFQGNGGENYGTFSKAGSSTVGWKFDHLYALYPYSADATSDTEGSIRTSIPTEQNYTASSFDKDANLMVAVTDDINAKDLRFRNVCGYLKIKLYSETDAVISSVTLRGNGNERISGECTVTAACGEMPTVTMTGEDPQDEITGGGEGFTEKGEQPKQGEGYGVKPGSWGDSSTKSLLSAKVRAAGPEGDDKTYPRRSVIDCGEGGVRISSNKDNATEFIFAIPPTTFAKGFTVSVTDEFGGVHVKSTSKSVTVGRSRMVPFAAIRIDEAECGTRFTEFSVTAEGGMKYTGTISENAVKILAPKSVDRTKLRAEFKTDGKDVYVGATKQESGVTVNDFTSPVTYRVVSAKGQSREYEVEILERPYLIACWGDSYTHYHNSTYYIPILQSMLGNTWEVFDGGYSGDRSNEIAARQGAIVTRVRKSGGFWIPADKTSVSITTIYTDDKDLDPESYNKSTCQFRPNRWDNTSTDIHGEHMVNPCTINGVECVVKSTSVTRTTPGEAVFVEDGTEIKTYGANHCKDADVTVIYIGTNGGWQHWTPNLDLLIAQNKAMVDFVGNGRYIVLASHISKNMGSWQEFYGGDNTTYLKKMHEAFTDGNGDHVIELRKAINERAEDFLIETGVYKSKSDISAKDKQFIANGDWPFSFFYSASDEHPNRYGSTAMAMLIVEKMKELGYLEK